jgi:hypothetical protein
MKFLFLISIIGMALLIGACSSTFLVIKDGRSTFVGSDSKQKFELLCASGDLEKVLADSHLEPDMKNTFYKYNCSTERSSDKVKQMFSAMTVDERKDIKSAFRKNGYEINKMFC